MNPTRERKNPETFPEEKFMLGKQTYFLSDGIDFLLSLRPAVGTVKAVPGDQGVSHPGL